MFSACPNHTKTGCQMPRAGCPPPVLRAETSQPKPIYPSNPITGNKGLACRIPPYVPPKYPHLSQCHLRLRVSKPGKLSPNTHHPFIPQSRTHTFKRVSVAFPSCCGCRANIAVSEAFILRATALSRLHPSPPAKPEPWCYPCNLGATHAGRANVTQQNLRGHLVQNK